jgi:hypothetical protein
VFEKPGTGVHLILKFSRKPEPEVLFDFQILKKKTRVTQNYAYYIFGVYGVKGEIHFIV